MSRFAGAWGADDSSSDDDKSDQGDTQAQEEKPAQAQTVSKYIMDSDDEGDDERHFKTGLEKKWEALEKVLDESAKHAKISDFNAMDNDLPKMAGEIAKASNTLFTEKGDKLPNRVLRVLMLFDDTISEVTGAMKKKMNKTNASSFNKLKQKFKKYLQGTNEGDWLYETQLINYREDPQVSEEEKKEESDAEDDVEEEEEEEEEDDEEEEEDDEVKGAKAEAAKEKGDAKEGDEEDEYGEDYYDEEDYGGEDKGDDSDDGDIVGDSSEINSKLRQKYAFLWKTREQMTASERRWKWVKKEKMPADLTALMDALTNKKGKKKDKEDGDDDDKKKDQVIGEKEIKEEAMTQIKRDYLAMDFTIFINV